MPCRFVPPEIEGLPLVKYRFTVAIGSCAIMGDLFNLPELAPDLQAREIAGVECGEYGEECGECGVECEECGVECGECGVECGECGECGKDTR